MYFSAILAFTPRIIDHPKNVLIDAYASVALKCTSKLLGNIKVIWQKSGSSRLPRTASVTNTRSQDKITSILNITKALTHYSGFYYCYVKNEIGGINSSQAQLQVKGSGAYVQTYVRPVPSMPIYVFCNSK